jgi:xanthine phosphoribosyltransferase
LRFAVVINNKSSKVEVDVWADVIDRAEDKRWFVFPWESVGTRDSIVEEALSVPERLA